jgi:hypothetical protein
LQDFTTGLPITKAPPLQRGFFIPFHSTSFRFNSSQPQPQASMLGWPISAAAVCMDLHDGSMVSRKTFLLSALSTEDEHLVDCILRITATETALSLTRRNIFHTVKFPPSVRMQIDEFTEATNSRFSFLRILDLQSNRPGNSLVLVLHNTFFCLRVINSTMRWTAPHQALTPEQKAFEKTMFFKGQNHIL